MKRKISLIVAIVLLLCAVTGCGGSKKPEKVVETYCEALKEFDSEKARGCISGDNIYTESIESSELGSDDVANYIKECASKMEYSIGEAQVDGDVAQVPVSFTYVDTTPVVTSAIADYFSQALVLAFSGSNADDEAMEQLFAEILNEKIETVDTLTATADITFDCEKIDGEWKIINLEENEDALLGVITGNFATAFADMFGDDTNTSSEESSDLGAENSASAAAETVETFYGYDESTGSFIGEDFEIKITEAAIVSAGEVYNKYNDEDIVIFLYDFKNTGTDSHSPIDWVYYFDVIQDNDSNVINELDSAIISNSDDLDYDNYAKIKSGGTGKGAVAYVLSDNTTPVELHFTPTLFGDEVDVFTYTIAKDDQ